MKVKLEHYSRERRKIIDPEFMGTAYAGEERKRPERVPRSYWYLAGTNPEHWFKNYTKHTWEGNLRLYDIGKDELIIYDSAFLFEERLKNAGFDGYYNSGFYPEIVAIFKKLETK